MPDDNNLTCFEKLPPEVVQQIIGHLNPTDLLSCRLVSTNLKIQTDQVIGFKNHDEDDPNLIWNPRATTQLKCKEKENFLIQVLPGTTVVKTQIQIDKFLKYAAERSPSSSNPFQNSALIYRSASRMRIPALCANRDLFIVFDRPVAGLSNLFSLYGHHLTSFVFDCKNQSFYQFLTEDDLGRILEHLPNLKFLGINIPFKLGLFLPTEQDDGTEKVKLPPLPHLESISLGQAISAVCCRGYGDGSLALEQILGAYGNQVKMLTMGESGQVRDLSDSYVRVFIEDDPSKQIQFENMESLKIFSCMAPFDLLQCIAVCPAHQWNLKRLSLQMQSCFCNKDFSCPLLSWWRSIPNILMSLMTKFSHSLEEFYVDSKEREIDILHWIYPCNYEWQEDKEEHRQKYLNNSLTPCENLKKITLPAVRLDTKVMGAILKRCAAMEDLCFLRGTGGVGTDRTDVGVNDVNYAYYHYYLQEIWTSCPTLKKITVVKELDELNYIYKHCRNNMTDIKIK